MFDYSLFVLDLARNAIEAKANQIEIDISIDEDCYHLVIKDNGIGFQDSSRLFQKGFSTKSNHRGLGLFQLKEAIDICGGTYQLTCNHLTCLDACIKRTDLIKVGHLADSLMLLFLEDVDYTIHYHDPKKDWTLSTKSLKQKLGCQDLTQPKTLIQIKQYLEGGLL